MLPFLFAHRILKNDVLCFILSAKRSICNIVNEDLKYLHESTVKSENFVYDKGTIYLKKQKFDGLDIQ